MTTTTTTAAATATTTTTTTAAAAPTTIIITTTPLLLRLLPLPLPTTYYLLPTAYYLLPTTFTYYLLPTTCYLLPTTYYRALYTSPMRLFLHCNALLSLSLLMRLRERDPLLLLTRSFNQCLALPARSWPPRRASMNLPNDCARDTPQFAPYALPAVARPPPPTTQNSGRAGSMPLNYTPSLTSLIEAMNLSQRTSACSLIQFNSGTRCLTLLSQVRRRLLRGSHLFTVHRIQRN